MAQWLISLVSFLFYLLPQNEKAIPAYFLSLNVETIASTIAFKLLLLIYFGFLIYKCIQQIVMLSGFRNLMSSLDVHQQTAHHDLIKKWNRKLKLRSDMRLCISEKYDTAFTFGFLKPIIVLPVSIITTLPPAQIESILLHEIAHIKNKDFLVNIFLELSEAMFSFNPFVWKITKEIKVLRELACDEFVMQQGTKSTTYADALYQLALARPALKFGLAAVGKKQYLLHRIQSLNSYQEKTIRTNKWTFLFAASIVLVLAILSVPVQNIIKNDNQNKRASQIIPIPSSYIINKTPSYKEIKTAESSSNVIGNWSEKPNNAMAKTEVKIKNKPISLTDKDETAYHLPTASQVNFDAEKNKTVAILEEENKDGTVTTIAVEIKVVNGSNQITPLWKWQSKPVSADSIRKDLLATDSLRKYQ